MYEIYLLQCVQCYTPDDGQRNCPKHVQFYSKNKFEKLVHLFGFILRINHDARPSECQKVSATPVTAQYSYAIILCFPAIRSIWSLLPPLPCALKEPASPSSSWYSSDPPGKCCDSGRTSTWLWPLPSRSFPLHYSYTTLTSNGVQSGPRNKTTRVGTLIVATIYLQLIQNRHMFRSFTVLQCSHQHCVQPVASDMEVVGYL